MDDIITTANATAAIHHEVEAWSESPDEEQEF